MRNLTSLTSFLPEVSNKETDHDGTDFTLCALNFVSFKWFFGPRLYHITYMEVKLWGNPIKYALNYYWI